MRFSRQILLLQVGVVVLMLGLGLALVTWQLRTTLNEQYGQRALAIARSVAVDPVVIAEVAAKRPGGELERRSKDVTSRTDSLFVVITDDQEIRLAHPDEKLIGQRVSTSAKEALAGNDVVSAVQEGTRGLSVRSKTPIRTAEGRVVGEVSVGFTVADPTEDFNRLLTTTLLFAGGALLLGVGASALLNRRLRRVTHGLEPQELSELLYEREAVLHGIGEGVLAVDASNRVSVRNEEAERLLSISLPLNAELSSLDLSPRLRKALDEGLPVDNLLAVAGNRVLVINSRAVVRDDHVIGTVLTFRDRTDLDTLSRELDGIRALSDGLRAQRHEFSNRLHTLSGLLQLGHTSEAVEYLQTITESAGNISTEASEAVSDPYLQALLVAKTEQAQEKGMTLRVSDDSWVPASVTDPVAVNTVVGNLVDNALHAARMGPRRPATVEIALLADGDTLHVSVVDSGPGVAPELRDRLFDEGVSTKLSPGHGLGLALARQAARARGGDVWLANPGDEESGALFVAALPGMLSTGRAEG
ncbi:two-component system, CitB family, sensor kinase [Amycolatopsis xylanica]|uniref:histidine kinase n=1 Tax=Amycolatopsis xylanica TaxID=589385 RepID=A0A1H3SPW2_9PSEU|nr:sensor histidine kinase [Amycolatopsis xylanica]SDZ40123.1 two-component system, CitB family, sensor kinase [Amycolatopsis xylanica]